MASSTASTSACLVGKWRQTVPTPTPAAPGDFFDLGLQPHLGEHVLGRGEHPLPVAPRVGAHRSLAKRNHHSDSTMGRGAGSKPGLLADGELVPRC